MAWRDWIESWLRLALRRARWLRMVKDRTWLFYVRRGRQPHPEGARRRHGSRPGGGSIGVALIGCGEHARTILWPALRWVESVQVRAAAVRTRTSARQIERMWGVPCVTDYRPLLERNDILAVIIATPTSLQATVAADALQAGKHVFCEAPGLATARDVEVIRRAVGDFDQVLQFGYRAHFMPIYQEFRHRLAARANVGGRIFRLAAPAIWDLASLAIFLNGPVRSVLRHDEGVRRQYAIRFENGDVGWLIPQAHRDASVGPERVEVVWDGHRLVAEAGKGLEEGTTRGAAKPMKRFSFDEAYLSHPERLQERTSAARSFLEQRGYVPELEAFIRSIRARQPSPCDLGLVASIFALEDAMWWAALSGRVVPVAKRCRGLRRDGEVGWAPPGRGWRIASSGGQEVDRSNGTEKELTRLGPLEPVMLRKGRHA